VNGKSRNPEIHAYLVRATGLKFPKQVTAKEVMKKAVSDNSPAVRFLALALKK